MLSSEGDEICFKSVWLQNQILKTMYQRGHYKEVLAKVDKLVAGLAGSEDLELVYFRTKFLYIKAKTLKKTRQLQIADEAC